MNLTWLQLTIYGLACFRLAVLLSEDDGPMHAFKKLRTAAKKEAKESTVFRKTFIHEGIECLRCSGLWVALPIAMFAFFRDRLPKWLTATGDIFLLWVSLGALSILWNRAFPKR